MAGLEGKKTDKQALFGDVKLKQGIDGRDGKSAYQYAVDGGYTGTEEKFAKKLAEDIDVTEEVSKLSKEIYNVHNAVKPIFEIGGWNVLGDEAYSSVTRIYADKYKVNKGDIIKIASTDVDISYILICYSSDGVIVYPSYSWIDIVANSNNTYIKVDFDGYVRPYMRTVWDGGINETTKNKLASIITIYNVSNDFSTYNRIKQNPAYTVQGFTPSSGYIYGSNNRLLCDENIMVSKGDHIYFKPSDTGLFYAYILVKYNSKGEIINPNDTWTEMDNTSQTVDITIEDSGYVRPYLKWANDSVIESSKSYLIDRCEIYTSEKHYNNYPKEISVSSNAVFNTIKTAVEYSHNVMDCIIRISSGTYDLISEFGTAYFDGISGDNENLGLILKNRVHLIFASNSKVTCHYTGDNPNVKKYFQAIRPSTHGCTIENITLECSNIRYAIHDERVQNTDHYINKYLNCYITLDNSNNDVWTNRLVIGGGLGRNGEIIIKNCYFDSAQVNGAGKAFVYYHNSGASDAKSRIVVDANYFANDGTFYATYYGMSTKKTEILLSNNSMGSQFVKGAEGSNATLDNINLIAWNNEIRSN